MAVGRRHDREGVEHDGEVELGGCSVERLQFRVVERHADWCVDHHPQAQLN